MMGILRPLTFKGTIEMSVLITIILLLIFGVVFSEVHCVLVIMALFLFSQSLDCAHSFL